MTTFRNAAHKSFVHTSTETIHFVVPNNSEIMFCGKCGMTCGAGVTQRSSLNC